MITSLDQKLSAQMDAILHDAEFQKLESSWRPSNTWWKNRFPGNIKIEMLNVQAGALLDDFEDAPEIPKSGLQNVYTPGGGQPGGQPTA